MHIKNALRAPSHLNHAPVVVLCTLTSTRMRHPRNQVVENQNSQLGPQSLGEGGDDHKERWFGKARTIGAKLKSQSRWVLNPPFQILGSVETIDGRVTQRQAPSRRHGGLRLREKFRDGAGKPGHVPDTLGHKHGNLQHHVAAARQSQLTIPWCPTRDILSGELPRARHAWYVPRGPYYKGVTR